MKFFRCGAACLSMLLIAVLAAEARAQEGEAKVVDEIVARVNSSVILRSAYLRAQEELLQELKARGLKDAELEKQFNELKPIILDGLIDTELLSQRAKDLSIDVEPQVNQQLLRVMKENNLASLEDLEQKMREAGVDIQEVRRMLRNRFSSEAVRNREVFGKIYHGLTEKEKRDYYEQHKEAFTSPGEISLSRILIVIGKDNSAQALERAKDVVTQARAGTADFPSLAKRFSEEDLGKKGGLIDLPVKISELADEIRPAVANAPVGTVTDPIMLAAGYVIFRVDSRKEPVIKPFDEKEVGDEVAQRITYERGATEMDKYLDKVRGEAFIEVDPRYQLAESKVKSAQIKRVPYSDENRKGKKKDKDKDKEKKEEPKETTKAAAPVKP
ncbi:MAG: peptidyl-prolyl cis-trans isomerase [Acidobacteriota bacterium]